MEIKKQTDKPKCYFSWTVRYVIYGIAAILFFALFHFAESGNMYDGFAAPVIGIPYWTIIFVTYVVLLLKIEVRFPINDSTRRHLSIFLLLLLIASAISLDTRAYWLREYQVGTLFVIFLMVQVVLLAIRKYRACQYMQAVHVLILLIWLLTQYASW